MVRAPVGSTIDLVASRTARSLGYLGRVLICGRPLWTPREMQAIFEEDRHVVGCCHLSGL
jgi:hypothetical protein